MTRSRQRRWMFELLEQRAMLDGHGILWGVDAGLTLSFVPDGTQVGPESSQLFATLDKLGPTDAWQDAILGGFQTWARQTNADIGVVADDGSDLGVDGATSGDARFGDIRIAAIPMASGYFATSIPTNELVDGTWVGDVFFNSSANIESLDDLFAVALHEAGHVFGLEHNDDRLSPMYRHELPESTTPTNSDIDTLQRNFGLRRSDIYESQEEIPEIELGEVGGESTPGFAFGDIASQTDIDVFEVEAPDDADKGDQLSIRLVTNGISLLRAQLIVRTKSGSLIGKSRYRDMTDLGQIVTVNIGNRDDDDIIVRVRADGQSPYDVGAYSLVATYDNSTIVPEDLIASIATSRVRSLEQDDIQRFFNTTLQAGDEDALLDDDMGVDDEEGNEVELLADDAFPNATRFVTMNALSTATDVDRYNVVVPDGPDQGVVTVTLSHLTDDFRATVTITDEAGNPLEAEPLVNGSGTLIVQLPNVSASDMLIFKVGRHPISGKQVGNYELAVRLHQTAVTPNILAASSTGPVGRNEHVFRVNRTQLFQFGLDPDDGRPADGLVTAQVMDQNGTVLNEFISTDGELATKSVLLLPGEYKIVVTSLTDIGYELLASAVDEPLGVEPIDPTEDPFCGFNLGGLVQCILILGDVNGDGLVDFADFLDLANNFGKAKASRGDGDLNGDQTVGFADFLILASNFGEQNDEPTA